MAITSWEQFITAVRDSRVIDESELARAVEVTRGLGTPTIVARKLVAERILTRWQAAQILSGQQDLLREKYCLQDQVGYSERGPIYQAVDKQSGRIVTLYTVDQGGQLSPERLQQFIADARRVAALEHPHVAALYEIIVDADCCLLACEHVQGQDLKRLAEREQPMSPERIASLVKQLAAGLVAAHDSGIVHGALRPESATIDKDGTLKLTDLGLALLADNPARQATSAESVDYIAPEQAAGRAIGPRTDIYSLGCVFYFLATGVPPFGEGTAGERIQRHLDKTPERVRELRPDLPEHLAIICEKMMAKSSSSRYQSAAEVVAILDADDAPELARAGAFTTPDRMSAPAVPMAAPAPSHAVADAPVAVAPAPPRAVHAQSAPPTSPTPAPAQQSAPGVSSHHAPIKRRRNNSLARLLAILTVLAIGVAGAMAYVLIDPFQDQKVASLGGNENYVPEKNVANAPPKTQRKVVKPKVEEEQVDDETPAKDLEDIKPPPEVAAPAPPPEPQEDIELVKFLTLELPSAEPVEPTYLGKVPASKKDIAVGLIGGNGELPGQRRFSIGVAADGPNDKRTWPITYSDSKNPEMNVAEVVLEGEELTLRWTPEAAQVEDSSTFRFCQINVSAGGYTESIGLLEPVQAEPLAFDFIKGAVKISSVTLPADHTHVFVELLEPEGDFVGSKIDVTPFQVDSGSVTIDLSSQDSAVLKFLVDSTVSGSVLQMRLRPEFKLRKQTAPAEVFNKSSLKRFVEKKVAPLAIGAKRKHDAIQAKIKMLEQEKARKQKSQKSTPQQLRSNKPIERINEQLKALSTQLTKAQNGLNVLKQALDQLKQLQQRGEEMSGNARIHYRVYYDVEGHQVELARTTVGEDP